MAVLTYSGTVYSETIDKFIFQSVTKYLTAQFDPIIDPTILRPGDAYRFSSSG